MAPEQSENPHKVGPTADIYSFGCVLYHCLTGELPGIKHLDYDRLPAEYHDVIVKATAIHRQDRYKTSVEFRKNFDGVLGLTQDTASNARLVSDSEDARSRIASLASIKTNLNDLSRSAFVEFARDLMKSLGYRIVAHSSDEHVLFHVEDVGRGIGPVLAWQRRYNSPTTDLIHAQQAMTAQQCRFALYITTGRLSPEADSFAAANRRIVVIDRTGLALHMECHLGPEGYTIRSSDMSEVG